MTLPFAAMHPVVTDNSLHFARPVWMLAGLLACAGMMILFVRFDRRRDADLARIIHPRFRQRLTEGFSPRMRNIKRALWLLALWLAFAAIARPQKGYEWHEVKRKGIDILFAVDTSRSMLATDLTPNRLERARLGILDFVARLDGDRVGLIPFAGSAFALCPLTLDYDAFRESLNALDTDLIPRQGTDLASAIREAERLFEENGNNHRILVLLTDGEDLQGDVIEAAREAAKKGMVIHTVGVGSPEGASIPVQDRFGRREFVRDRNGEVVHTTLDEDTLKKIAGATNALYVPLGRGAEGLNTIYQEKLRLVPKSELNQRMERIPLERFEWPLGAAIALLVLEFFLGDRRRVKKGRVAGPAGSVSMASLALAVLGCGLSDLRASEDPRWVYNQGTEAYGKGDFNKAAESLRNSLRTQDLSLQQRAYYNLGNTLYRTGQGTLQKEPDATIKSWEAAIKAYDDALSLDGADEDARFNRELVRKKLDELKKQQKDNQDQKNDPKDQDQKDKQDKDQQDKDQQDKDQQDKDQQGKDQQGKDQQGKDKQDKDQQGKDQQGKDQQGKDQQGKDQQGKDQQGKDQQGKDQQGKDQQGKDQQGKDQQGKDQQGKDQQGKDQQGKDQQGKEPDSKEQNGREAENAVGNERAQKQEMTPEEAKQLLEALRGDERTVIPIQRQPQGRMANPENSTKGKTW